MRAVIGDGAVLCTLRRVYEILSLILRFAGRLIASLSWHHRRFPTVHFIAEMAGLGSLHDVVVVNSSHNLFSLGTRPVYK
jgi:hypothetical protein